MTAGKRPRLMMRRTVSVASLGAGVACGGGAGGVPEVAAAAHGAAGSDHAPCADPHFQRAHQPQIVVVPHQVIGFEAPKSFSDNGGGGGDSEGLEFFTSSVPLPSPGGTKSRPFSGLSILADNKEVIAPITGEVPLASAPPPHPPHERVVGLGIVAALDKPDSTSVIRPSVAQVAAAPAINFQHHQSARYNGVAIADHRKQTVVDSANFQFCPEPNSVKCSLRPSFTALGFLESCYQCKRDIPHGRDIFMYRGDRAFCSTECRHQQILNDERLERREKCTSAALKQMGSVPQQARHHQRAKVTPATTAAAA